MIVQAVEAPPTEGMGTAYAAPPTALDVWALHPTLLRRARCLVPDPADAEDLASAAVLRAIERLDRYHPYPAVPFSAWVHRILTNVAIDRARHVALLQMRSLSTCVAAQQVTHDETRRLLEAAEWATILWPLVAALPPHYRRCLWLRHGHGYSLTESAAAMGRSRVSTKTIYYRAITRLRQALGLPVPPHIIAQQQRGRARG